MISKKHKKHTDLARPSFGNFSRNEWAIVGGPCAAIKLLADQIIQALSTDYKCAYADAAHSDEVKTLPGRLASGAFMEFTHEADYQQLNCNAPFNAFKYRETFATADLVLVNGNHHQAKAQVVIICESKRASLQKRIDQLTDVQLILLLDTDEVFDFIKEAIPGWDRLPVYRLEETGKVISFFKAQMLAARPVLNGLVLAGGKSQRMGFDKGAVDWHGKEQRYYAADLLKTVCNQVFISCRADQQADIDADYRVLPDTFTGLGPYGAILSAFREKPDNAWLIIACDLPLLNDAILRHLIDNRNLSGIATAYQSSFDGLPEPLIAIWEPKSYPMLLSFLAQGYSCPRKVLINSDTTLLNAPDPQALTNVNTPEELETIKQVLQQKATV